MNAAKKSRKKLNFKNFQKNLYTKNIPDPDILVRTGGYKRLSNFMLWQSCYSELEFLDILWPEISEHDIKLIFERYINTKRNFGRIKK